jgi:5-methylcytosine-specific restriction endonuclease McrA
MSIPSAEEQLRFINGIQKILDEGSFVATYKFALLMALADFAVQSGQDGVDPENIDTADLAESFITSYWRQALPFVTVKVPEGKFLKMSPGGQPVIYSRIVDLRNRYDGSLIGLRNNAGEWRRLKSQVADTIARMPLWKLQIIGSEPICILYRQNGQGFQGRIIELLPGVLFNFRRHYDLIRNLVQGAWLRYVRRMNLASLGEADLDEFLFGSERSLLPGLREILKETQEDICLYCNRRIGEKGDIDHFIPWSKYPIEYGHNFVLAHTTCNRSKSDLLAAPEHLQKWCERNELHAASLVQGFNERGILHDYAATERIAGWAYGQAESCGAHLWLSKSNLLTADASWRSILSA